MAAWVQHTLWHGKHDVYSAAVRASALEVYEFFEENPLALELLENAREVS